MQYSESFSGKGYTYRRESGSFKPFQAPAFYWGGNATAASKYYGAQHHSAAAVMEFITYDNDVVVDSIPNALYIKPGFYSYNASTKSANYYCYATSVYLSTSKYGTLNLGSCSYFGKQTVSFGTAKGFDKYLSTVTFDLGSFGRYKKTIVMVVSTPNVSSATFYCKALLYQHGQNPD